MTIPISRPCLDYMPRNMKHVSSKEIAQRLASKGVSNISASTITKARAAFLVDALWKPGDTIKICFMDGTDSQKNFVQQSVNSKLAPLVNLKFVWGVSYSEADLKCSFKTKGAAYSMIGTQCKSVTDGSESINIGWLDNSDDFDSECMRGTAQVVIHEVCHALGMIHEHQNPRGNTIQWNIPVVTAALSGPPNYWNSDQIFTNMFQKYTEDQTNGSSYDSKSIMKYWFPPSWVLNPQELTTSTGCDQYNIQLSATDIEWLKKTYPGVPSIIKNPSTQSPNSTLTGVTDSAEVPDFVIQSVISDTKGTTKCSCNGCNCTINNNKTNCNCNKCICVPIPNKKRNIFPLIVIVGLFVAGGLYLYKKYNKRTY